jgi:hypothetical protein
VLFFLFNCFWWISNDDWAGNSKSTSEGGQKITSALIGFVLIFAAYWIAQLLELFWTSTFFPRILIASIIKFVLRRLIKKRVRVCFV